MAALKRLLPALAVLLILGGVPAFSGPASITGTARCHMPDLLEMKASTLAMEHDAQAPEALSSSGPIEVKEEERSGPPEQEEMIAQAQTDAEQTVTVYTVCAR